METNNSQLVIYQAPDGNMSIDVTVQNDTVCKGGETMRVKVRSV